MKPFSSVIFATPSGVVLAFSPFGTSEKRRSVQVNCGTAAARRTTLPFGERQVPYCGAPLPRTVASSQVWPPP